MENKKDTIFFLKFKFMYKIVDITAKLYLIGRRGGEIYEIIIGATCRSKTGRGRSGSPSLGERPVRYSQSSDLSREAYQFQNKQH
jgi:hypothetical protein